MTSAVPPWAYEKAAVHPYDPAWRDAARRERAQLTALLTFWLTDRVEHVGSTAVPGLAAKPIVDLMGSVTDLDATVTNTLEVLTDAGWCYVPPELDQRPWRRFFVKPDSSGQHRVAHLQLLPAGHPRWSQQLAFRDALRRDKQLASDYEALKRKLADEHGSDREAYTDGKAAFIASALDPQIS